MSFYLQYPASAAGGANPSVGTNDQPAPLSSTQVGGVDSNGDLQPLRVEPDGTLYVTINDDISGLATEAKQDDQIAQGATIITNTGNTATNTGTTATNTGNTVTQLTTLNSKVIKADTDNVTVTSAALPTGAATAANQVTGNNSLSSIDTKTPALGQALAAASVPVVLTAAQLSTLTPLTTVTVTQGTGTNLHTVVDASALPTGAATEATLTTVSNTLTAIDAGIPTALGQTTMSASMPVTIASNQSALPVTTTTSDVTAAGTITTQNLVPAGTATAGSAVLSGALNGAGTASIQVTGTYTGALSLQYTVDGTNWVTVGGTPFLRATTGALSATIASATQDIFQIETVAMAQFRITGLAAMTGTATVSIRVSRASSVMSLDAALPAGTNIIGALSANQSVNCAQMNGVAVTMGNGVSGTGVQRVTIASDSTGSIRVGGSTSANAPVLSLYASTPVTSGAYVQLIASTTSAANALEIFDSSGQALYFATGAAASEVNQFIIYPGGNGRIPFTIAAGTRISIKAVNTSATSGQIILNLYA